MNKIFQVLLIVCVIAGINGCASKPTLYHWGSYEDMLYKMYVKPSKATPLIQIGKITEDIHKANAKQYKVAPGIYAHLGMLYAQIGDAPAAISALKMEKKLFPESTVMIDGLISRAFPGVSLDVEELDESESISAVTDGQDLEVKNEVE